jgi:DNA primase
VAEDVTCRVALLPDGQDPADLCLAAPERVAPLVEGATSAVAFLIATAATQAGPTIEERARVAEGLAKVLARLKNPVVRDEYTRQTAAALSLRPDQVARLVGGGPVAPVSAPAGPTRGAEATERPGESAEIGLTLLALLTAHPRLAPLAAREGLLALLPDPDTGVLLREAIRQQAETGRVDVSTLLDHAPEALRDRVAARLLDDDPGGDEANASRALFELIGRLRLQELERELATLTPAIQAAGARGADEEKRDLVLKRLSLARQKDELVTAMSRGQRPPV